MSKSTQNFGRPVPSLEWFEAALFKLSNHLEAPKEVELRGTTCLRYSNPTVQSATLLKLARFVSGLSAGELLLQTGHLQELATIQRTMDELHEDILFLCLGVLTNQTTNDHANYLAAFWEEEPDFRTFSGHQRNRHQVPRKKIRRFLSEATENGKVDHASISVSAYLSRLLSGYVHGAAPQLAELIDVQSKKFRVRGYPESPTLRDHAHDFENQFFRGLINVVLVARISYLNELAEDAKEFHDRIASHFHGSGY
jgi:hypothetical protein